MNEWGATRRRNDAALLLLRKRKENAPKQRWTKHVSTRLGWIRFSRNVSWVSARKNHVVVSCAPELVEELNFAMVSQPTKRMRILLKEHGRHTHDMVVQLQPGARLSLSNDDRVAKSPIELPMDFSVDNTAHLTVVDQRKEHLIKGARRLPKILWEMSTGDEHIVNLAQTSARLEAVQKSSHLLPKTVRNDVCTRLRPILLVGRDDAVDDAKAIELGSHDVVVVVVGVVEK